MSGKPNIKDFHKPSEVIESMFANIVHCVKFDILHFSQQTNSLESRVNLRCIIIGVSHCEVLRRSQCNNIFPKVRN